MRLASLALDGAPFLGARTPDGTVNLNAAIPALPWRDVGSLVRDGGLDDPRLADAIAAGGHLVDPSRVTHRPTAVTGRILCLGLNYVDHAAESRNARPEAPVIFGRYASSFVGHNEGLERPRVSTHFDYEAELALVIGRRARHITAAEALAHVAGYTLVNDGSVRDWQVRTPQWTLGKNFDRTGSMGPELVTADELPPGARGLRLEGRLNGAVMQSGDTSDMIFDVETTLAYLSDAMALEPGDVVVMGTPSGIGFARKPPVFMVPGDVFEVVVERVGTLRNPVIDEPAAR